MDGDQPQPDDQPWGTGRTDEGPDSHPGPAAETGLMDLSDLPEPPQTGDQDVDEATGNVARAMHQPLEEQLAAYELAHRTLQDRLADVES